MGLLVNGQWLDQWYDTESNKGEFVRQESYFRKTISTDAENSYTPEADRYHLYVSLACPWAHRTLIFRKLKQLEKIISVSVVRAPMLENGWEFSHSDSRYKDDLHDSDYLYQVYLKADPNYQGRVTVPVLWDKKTHSIVNNESSDIIRIFNNAFNALTGNQDDYYPQALRSEIDAINQRVYAQINNGVYRVGFATEQAAYEQAYHELFAALDWLENHLSSHRYLVGDTITEADWRLFTTLLRFDDVYHGHFKCNRQRLIEFHHITHYVRELYQVDGVKETWDSEYTKTHYYASHKTINPTGIVPLGARNDFAAQHDRTSL